MFLIFQILYLECIPVESNMAAPIVSAAARENLQAWLKKLQIPGLPQGDMAKIYSEWADKADYETVGLMLCLIVLTLLFLFEYQKNGTFHAD